MKIKLLTALLTLLMVFVASGCKVVDLPEQSQDSNASQDEGNPEDSPEEEPMPNREEIPEKPLSVLEDNVVYSSDYTYYYNLYRNNMIRQYAAFMDVSEIWDQEIDGKTMREMLVDDAFNIAKEYAVFSQAAASSGMKLSQEDLDNIENEVKDVLNSQFGNDEQNFLNNYSLTPSQMRGMLERSNLASRYVNSKIDEIEISEKEITDYYKENKDNLDTVVIRHILIDCTDEMSEKEQDEAKAKAEDILEQIKGGADIGKLAAEHSTDPGSKDNNGEYVFGKGQMVPEFEEWAFAANSGDQGIVKTSYGYHVMEKIKQSDIEDVRERIVQNIQQEKFPEYCSDIYDKVKSAEWSLDQELLDKIVAASEL